MYMCEHAVARTGGVGVVSAGAQNLARVPFHRQESR
jgi:hypothetical protein